MWLPWHVPRLQVTWGVQVTAELEFFLHSGHLVCEDCDSLLYRLWPPQYLTRDLHFPGGIVNQKKYYPTVYLQDNILNITIDSKGHSESRGYVLHYL